MSKGLNIRRRKIRPRPTTKQQREKERHDEALSAYERQTLTATNYVLRHNQYPTIIAMMRLGNSNADIADFFLERGDFTVNRKTAISYLAMFRRAHPDVCKPSEQAQNDGIVSYDHLFDGNSAMVTSEVEMAKLIALQKARIAIDFNTERGINKLFGNTYREIATLGDLVEKYAKLRAGKGSVSPGVGAFADADDVKDGIQNIQHDEQKRAAVSAALQELLILGKR